MVYTDHWSLKHFFIVAHYNSRSTVLDGAQMIREAQQDLELQKIIADVCSKHESRQDFMFSKGVINKGHLVISSSSPPIPLLLKEFHCTPWGVILDLYALLDYRL